jgi:hypothetical protein
MEEEGVGIGDIELLLLAHQARPLAGNALHEALA